MNGRRKWFGSSVRARDEPSSKRVGGVGISRKSPSYVRGLVLSRESPKLQHV